MQQNFENRLINYNNNKKIMRKSIFEQAIFYEKKRKGSQYFLEKFKIPNFLSENQHQRS